MADDATLPMAQSGGLAPPVGARIARFQTISSLGSGGMGIVLEAHDPELDRRVAIKLLHSGSGGARLQREAQAMAKLAHPNVVAVYEVGRIGEQTFIAMELVEGSTLRGWLREPHPWREVVAIFVGAGRGLAAAHAAGLVHRDFKPENVLLGADRRPRVTDFGLVSSESGQFATPTAAALDLSLTIEGSAVGTPAYMSPEHWAGTAVDARSDQFSFCVSLWEALYRVRPFVGDSVIALRDAVTAGRIAPPPADRDVPRWLEAALRRGLAAGPAARWPTLTALLDVLEARARPRRPPLFVVGGAAATVAGILVWSIAPGPARGESCARAGDPMASTWNDQARGRLRDALLSLQKSYGGDVADRVIARLDDYADGWKRGSIDACEATHVRHQQSAALLDRRTGCLADRRRDLDALVTQLTERPDGTSLDVAVKAAYALPALDACSDAERLLATVAPPSDDARAAELGAIVADARSRMLTGHYAEGWALLEPALAAIRAFGHGPLTAQALLTAADLQSELDRLDEAAAALEEAVGLAARARDDDLAARTGVALLRVIGSRQRKTADANRLLPLVAAQVGRAGDPPELRARLLRLQGEIEGNESHYEESRAHLAEALALFEEALGPEDPEVVVTMTALGLTEANLGRFADARKTLERAAELAGIVFGPDHPNVGKGLNNLGYLAQQEGDLTAALDYFRRAFASKERSLGLENASTARTLANIANVLSMQGHSDEAVPELKRAIAIFERTLGPEHPEVVQNVANLGTVLGNLGSFDEARDVLEGALAKLIAAYGEDHGDLAFVYEGLAIVEQNAGNPEAAIAAAEKSLAVRRGSLGEDHPLTGTSWGLVATTRAAAGRFRDALLAFETGVGIIEKAQDPDSPRLVKLLAHQALCLVELGRARDAVPVAERALALATANQMSPADAGYSEYALARARNDRALAEHALESLRASGPDAAPRVAEIEAWLARRR